MAETGRKSWLRPKNGLYNLVTMTKTELVGEKIAIQSWLRPDLTAVGRNKDYESFRGQLARVDKLLRQAHLESMAVDFAMEGYECYRSREHREKPVV